MGDELLNLRLIAFESKFGVINAGDADAGILLFENFGGLLSGAFVATQQVDRAALLAGGSTEAADEARAGHALRQRSALDSRGPDQRHSIGHDQCGVGIDRSEFSIASEASQM